MSITVVGGLYRERCAFPFWDQWYGSGGRAAAALANQRAKPARLLTAFPQEHQRFALGLGASWGVKIDFCPSQHAISFDYLHCLSTPSILPLPERLLRSVKIRAEDDAVVCFGMLEAEPIVNARIAVYDPQSVFEKPSQHAPRAFRANGSRADRLAIVANSFETRVMTGEKEPKKAAKVLMHREGAEVVIVKRGIQGALVMAKGRAHSVPAYFSERVWSIGSGDIFAAAFASFWALDGLDPVEAADCASRMTAIYAETGAAAIVGRKDMRKDERESVKLRRGRVYLAGPFFTVAQRWLVEEALDHLRRVGLDVFSPVHDVGRGAAHEVAPADLAGLKKCDRVLALLDGADPGTVFEVGWARARGLPVIAYAESLPDEALKMIAGSNCRVVRDFGSAIYHTAWCS
jgi:nucleoside 2-deoxyribosyltransferase